MMYRCCGIKITKNNEYQIHEVVMMYLFVSLLHDIDTKFALLIDKPFSSFKLKVHEK